MRTERLVVDAVAAVDYLNPARIAPPAFEEVNQLVLPLPVLGELRFRALKLHRAGEGHDRATGGLRLAHELTTAGDREGSDRRALLSLHEAMEVRPAGSCQTDSR